MLGMWKIINLFETKQAWHHWTTIKTLLKFPWLWTAGNHDLRINW